MGLNAIKEKELDVIKLIADGIVAKEIAKKLGVSVITVNTRKNRAKDKLDALNGAHLVSICYKNKLLK